MGQNPIRFGFSPIHFQKDLEGREGRERCWEGRSRERAAAALETAHVRQRESGRAGCKRAVKDHMRGRWAA